MPVRKNSMLPRRISRSARKKTPASAGASHLRPRRSSRMPSKTKPRDRRHWTTTLGQASAHPAAFAVVLLYALAWFAFDRKTFDFNAVATLIVWVMTLFIQRSSRRDTLAIHAKIDELIRADENARSELTRLDEKEPEVIAKHRDAEVQALSESR